MAALRWFLLSIVAFGGGAAAAFALHPPKIGIPAAAAASLSNHLRSIEQLARDGRCGELNKELGRTGEIIDNRQKDSSAAVVDQLSAALQTLAQKARETCNAVIEAQDANRPELPTTPTEPEPSTPTAPEPSTPAGADGGGPDPGSGEGTTPSGGSGGPDSGGDSPGTTPSGGGGANVTPNGAGGLVRRLRGLLGGREDQ